MAEKSEKRVCIQGHEMPEGARFCSECGSPPAPTAEEVLRAAEERIAELGREVLAMKGRLRVLEDVIENVRLKELRQSFDELIADIEEAEAEFETPRRGGIRGWLNRLDEATGL
jgi:hypothetical protein